MKFFIVIVIQSFNDSNNKQSRFLGSGVSQKFNEIWSKYDPNVIKLIFYFFIIGGWLHNNFNFFKIHARIG
jgi:hypothetical protein